MFEAVAQWRERGCGINLRQNAKRLGATSVPGHHERLLGRLNSLWVFKLIEGFQGLGPSLVGLFPYRLPGLPIAAPTSLIFIVPAAAAAAVWTLAGGDCKIAASWGAGHQLPNAGERAAMGRHRPITRSRPDGVPHFASMSIASTRTASGSPGSAATLARTAALLAWPSR